MKVFNPFLALLLCAFSSEIWSAPPGWLVYNNGVDAWRAGDYAEARLQWGRALVEGGPDETFNNLGYLLYYGQGGTADVVAGVELWRKGAVLGVSEAQLHLGHAFETGKGAPFSPVLAYAWYKCAARTAKRLGSSNLTESEIARDALQALEHIATTMTLKQRKAAERRAEIYFTRYGERLDIEGEPTF